MTKVLWVLFAFLLPMVALAGGGSTAEDGGHGVVCERPSSSIPRTIDVQVEILDLYEARKLYGPAHWKNKWLISHDVDNRLLKSACHELKERKLALMKLLSIDAELQAAFDDACEIAATAKIGQHLSLTDDSGELMVKIPHACKVKQFAVYKRTDDRFSVSVDARYIRHFTELELAALLLHESLHTSFPRGSTVAIRQFVMYAMASRRFQKANLAPAQIIAGCRCEVDKRAFVSP